MDPAKIAKTLSLAASDNEAEALRALQTARRMLAAEGLDFVDIANLVIKPAETDETEALRAQLSQLRREIRQLKIENRRLRDGAPVPESADAPKLAAAERRLAAETAAREQAEASCDELTEHAAHLERMWHMASEQLSLFEAERQAASGEVARLAAEVRRLNASTAYLNSELERSENERYRLIAVTQELALGRARRPFRRGPARSMAGRQYSLFERSA